jgi:uncharacterized protein (TIGR02594 family)
MYRRILTPALAAVSIAGVALAGLENAHSKPARGQQAEAKQTQTAKRHGKQPKRLAKRTRRAKHAERARPRDKYLRWGDQVPDPVKRARPAVKRVKHAAKRAKRPVKEVKRATRQAKVVATRQAPRQVRREVRAVREVRVVARPATRSRARKVAQAKVARVRLTAPPNFPVRDDRFDFGPVKAVARPSHAGRNAYAAVHSYGNGGWSDVVSEARRYIGTNPTGRRDLWCARFMNFVLERLGYQGTGSDMAHSFASYGRRVSGPQVGAIAVLSRGPRGGHVGVVSGVDEKGNPIIISGNHNNSVAEAAYPRARVRIYVMPRS